ncbi:hypothetical protein EDC01DRAFT_746188 [Geopyxis carbonaria]|nr:hypothetical protein EDC01DRAFT_746188 [Geopyxis carbonaria]
MESQVSMLVPKKRPRAETLRAPARRSYSTHKRLLRTIITTEARTTCEIWTDEVSQFQVVVLRCNHTFCLSCLAEMFKRAITSADNYPPRCCEPIPISYATEALTATELETFSTSVRCAQKTAATRTATDINAIVSVPLATAHDRIYVEDRERSGHRRDGLRHPSAPTCRPPPSLPSLPSLPSPCPRVRTAKAGRSCHSCTTPWRARVQVLADSTRRLTTSTVRDRAQALAENGGFTRSGGRWK